VQGSQQLHLPYAQRPADPAEPTLVENGADTRTSKHAVTALGCARVDRHHEGTDAMQKLTQGSAIPVVTKTRLIKDCATGDWSVEFQILQVDGRRTRVLVPAADAESPRALARRLRTKGARSPRKPLAREKLILRVIATEPGKIVYQLANPGWQRFGSKALLFSCGLRLIGETGGATEYSVPAFIEESRAKAFAVRGTLEDWKP
jgi:hypothetical protein